MNEIPLATWIAIADISMIKKFRRFVSVCLALATSLYVEVTWRWSNDQRALHDLPERLCITLTSYPPRFASLHLTLKSLLAQSIQPDHIRLWIAEDDIDRLPMNVINLKARGLEILTCSDIKSYKKIIPSLVKDKNDFLVIADDDVYYHRHWLRELVQSYVPRSKEVICARAHRIRVDKVRGMPLPYFEWETDVLASESETRLFPTGIGGVLYPPNVFHADVTRSDIFLRLCPSADDVWLYWMATLNGAKIRKVGRKRRQILWPGSQRVTLLATNVTANDEQIRNIISEYGFPGRLSD